MKIKFLRLFMIVILLLCLPKVNFGQAPNLGKAATYAVFTDTGAFNTTGSTVIYGDIGSYVGAVNGNPTVYGSKHYGDSTAFYVSKDVDKAYTDLQSRTCGSVLGTTLGSSQTLYPGIYCTGGATTLGGNLILDAQGNASAIFIIKIGGAFATGSATNILLIHKASYKNVYWQIDGAVAVGDSSAFAGTIIANGAITFSLSSTLAGRALSTSGAITLSNSAMTRDSSLIGTGPITNQPDSQIKCLGASASFFVTTASTGYTYQWRKGSTKLSNGGNISGATSDTLTINPVSSADGLNNYNVIISKSGSPNDTSKNVALIINSVTVATVAGQTVCSGTNAIFKVSSTSTGPATLSYQWQVSTNNGTTFSNITGATASAYTVTTPGSSSDNYQYRAMVSSGACSSFTSTAGTLRVNSITAATVAGQSVCSGTNAVFTVSTTSSGSAALTYQWLLSTNGGTSYSNMTGATASSYTVTAPTSTSDNYQYENIVTSTGCASYTSTAGKLRVNGISAATVAGQIVCSGTNAVFTVSQTSSGSAALTYQWLLSTNGGASFSNITGATASSYTVTTPGGISDNNQYENIVTSTGCASYTSTAGTLRVNGISSATVAGQAVCSGSDAVFTVSQTSTGPASLSYQWQVSTNGGGSFSNISGATASSYTVSAPGSSSDNYEYLCLVSSGTCSSFTSTSGTLRVNNVSAATVAGQTVCSGSDAIFTVSQTSTGSASLSYQWQISTNSGSTFSNISGATASSYTVAGAGASSDNNQYRSVVSSGSCAAFTSTTGTLRVNAVITAVTSGQTVCAGTNATFTLSATNSGPASLSYQWKESINGGSSFSNISGATGTSYIVSAPGASSDNYQFECVITSGSCSSVASNVATLRVNAITSATIVSHTVCAGSDASFSVSVTNTGSASLSYQWLLSTDNGTSFNNISGATSATYTQTSPAAASDNYQYQCIVTSGTCTAYYSTIATLRVNEVTSAVVTNQVVCSGTDATFAVSVTNTGSASLGYQWMMSTDGGTTFSVISGATASTYKVSAPDPTFDNFQYKCIVTSGSCASDTSTTGTLRVNSVTGALVSSQTVCSGADATFKSYVINTGSGVLTYQWKISTNGGTTFSDITNTNNATYTVSAPNGSYDNNEYEFTVASASCPAFSSAAAILRVNGAVAAPVLGQTVCAATNAIFVSSPTSTGPASLSYQWQLSTNGGLSFTDIKGANDTLYTVIAPDATSDNYEYRNLITSGTCPAYTSSTGALRVNDITASTVASQSVCSGFDATFTNAVTNSGPAFLTYQWKRSTDGGATFSDIPGATGNTFIVATPTSTSDGYQYENIVTSSGCMSMTSDAGILSINTAPNIVSGPENACVCVYTNASFAVDVTGTNPTYQWRRGNVNLVDSGRVSGSKTNILTINAITINDTAHNYNVIIMGTCSPNDTSNNVILSLCKQSSINANTAENENKTVSIFPNPFTNSASVSFIAANSENISVSVYDVRGVKIQTIYDGSVVANNTYTYELNGGNLTPDIYFVRFASQNNVQYVKMIKLRP